LEFQKVQQQNHLGIFISQSGSTVVCISDEHKKLLDCFSVSAQDRQQSGFNRLAELIAQQCQQRQLQFTDVAVALDCRLFLQHSVHTGFTERKQIASTVRFDTEETLATDVSDMSIAFKVDRSDESGSDLTVFTAKRKLLADVLSALQSNNLDPVTIEPDVNCLAAFISTYLNITDDNCILAVLASLCGYIIAFPSSQKSAYMRSFLLGETAGDRISSLQRLLPVSFALLGRRQQAQNCLKMFDSAGLVDSEMLAQRLAQQTSSLDLLEQLEVNPENLAECPDKTELAIACGAALVAQQKYESVNFRDDFAPYQGRKLRLQKAFKFLSISVTVLLLAVGMYFQLQLIQARRYHQRLRNRFEADYLAVVLDEKNLPAKTRTALRKLGSELRRIESENKGLFDLTGKKAVTAKLQLLLEAFNNTAKQTNLQLDTISITTKSISISGSTSSRKKTLKLRDAIKNVKLGSLQENLRIKAGRDNFNITIVTK